jgi:hypothetical protein
MTIATNAENRLGLPDYSYKSLSTATNGSDSDSVSLDWEEGVSNSGNSAHDNEEIASEERIILLPNRPPENTGLFDFDARDEASHAAEKMSNPATTSVIENTQMNHDAGVLETHVERAYLQCYTAASASLLCLSVISFILPSISTYSPERTAVQTLGYTASVISLLSGLAAGASVVAAYTGSGYLHK